MGWCFGAWTGALLVAASTLFALNVAFKTPVAHADLQNPRQQFLRDSVGGLFLHWGERTSPQHTSCSQWEADVTAGGWDANYWVNEAKKLHLRYLVLATFHSRLGYARPWPFDYQEFTVTATGPNWDTWATVTFTAALGAGSSTIRLTATTANGGPNLDKITVG